MQPVPARVGRRGQHGENGLKVGLSTHELDVVLVARGTGFCPLHSQRVEFVGLVPELIFLPRQRGIEAGDRHDTILQAVTENHLGTPQGIHQLRPPWPDEPHRNREPGLVERGNGTGEHFGATWQGCQPGNQV